MSVCRAQVALAFRDRKEKNIAERLLSKAEWQNLSYVFIPPPNYRPESPYKELLTIDITLPGLPQHGHHTVMQAIRNVLDDVVDYEIIDVVRIFPEKNRKQEWLTRKGERPSKKRVIKCLWHWWMEKSGSYYRVSYGPPGKKPLDARTLPLGFSQNSEYFWRGIKGRLFKTEGTIPRGPAPLLQALPLLCAAALGYMFLLNWFDPWIENWFVPWIAPTFLFFLGLIDYWIHRRIERLPSFRKRLFNSSINMIASFTGGCVVYFTYSFIPQLRLPVFSGMAATLVAVGCAYGIQFIPRPRRWTESVVVAIGVVPAFVSIRWLASLIDEMFFGIFKIPYSEVSFSSARQSALIAPMLAVTLVLLLFALGVIGWSHYFGDASYETTREKMNFTFVRISLALIFSTMLGFLIGAVLVLSVADSIKDATQSKNAREFLEANKADQFLQVFQPVCLEPLKITGSLTAYLGKSLPEKPVLLAPISGDWIWAWDPEVGRAISARRENVIIKGTEWHRQNCRARTVELVRKAVVVPWTMGLWPFLSVKSGETVGVAGSG